MTITIYINKCNVFISLSIISNYTRLYIYDTVTTDYLVTIALLVHDRDDYSGIVVVASQRRREEALSISNNVDPFWPLSLAQYCILERIGRTRTMGDVTQGKVGDTL